MYLANADSEEVIISMDMLLICRDALASSFVSNLMLAVREKERGVSAAILFTGEAVSALNHGTFLWPRELQEAPIRLAMADNGKKAGLPVTGRGEARQLDIWAVFENAKKAGVPLYASPFWVDLLGLQGKLPAGVKALDAESAGKLFAESRQIIGSL